MERLRWEGQTASGIKLGRPIGTKLRREDFLERHRDILRARNEKKAEMAAMTRDACQKPALLTAQSRRDVGQNVRME